MPKIEVRAGAVARSLLVGMCAINPNIRRTHPELTDALRSGLSARLPPDMRLRVALCRSPRVRISGGTAGFILFGPYSQPRISDMPPGFTSDASVYFPPLAWVLTRDRESLLDRQGFGDATSWLEYGSTETMLLPELLPDLPYASYPLHDPELSEWWTEMYSDEISEIIETEPLPASVLHRTK